MREFASGFYKSQAWKNRRAAYAKSVGGLCERCKGKGLVTPGEIVHHKTPLTPANIYDTSITLGGDNLELLCRKCHAEVHDARQRRYKIDEAGRVIPTESPPVARDFEP